MRIALTLAAALGVLAAAPLSSTFAANADGMTMDLSAQQNVQQKKPAAARARPAAKPAARQANRPAARPAARANNNRNANVNRNVKVKRSVTTTRPNGNTRTRNVTTTKQRGNANTRNVTTTKRVRNNAPPRQVTFKANRRTFAGTRARVWRNSGTSSFRGRNYSYWRGGPWRHRYNGGWRTYAALSTLTAIAFAGATYYPYAYIDAPQDVCEGITEDGCQLSWAEVDTVEGGVAPACVTYCPWE